MSLQMVTVTGTLKHLDGTPQTGRVEFALPYTLVDPAGHVLWSDRAVVAELDVNGAISVQLPATDSAGVSPTNWTYTVTIATDGNNDPAFQCLLPAATSSVHLDELVHVDVPPTVGVWVPVSALGNSVATLVNGKVPVDQLPAGSGGGVASVTAADGTIVVTGTATDPVLAVGSISESKVTGLTTDLSTLTSAASAAQSTANSAQTTANAAYVKPVGGIPSTDMTSAVQGNLTAAGTAYQKPGTGIPSADMASAVQTDLGLAASAYQKPGGGIPSTDMSAAVQASLALANTALQLAPTDPAAAAYSCHACNYDPLASPQAATIAEQWFMRILVRAGRQINLVKTLIRVAGVLSTTGLNGFALYSDDFSSLLWNSASDDSMWTATGEVSKAVTGTVVGLTNRTPTVDTWFRVGISAGRGYSTAPTFPFANFSSSSVLTDAGNYRCRYRAAAYSSWPASINPATDLSGVSGFVPPVLIG